MLALAPLWGKGTAPYLRADWTVLTNSAYLVRHGNDQVFRFDGSGNRVVVPDADEANFGEDEDFTVVAWIKAYPMCSKAGLQTRSWMMAHPQIARHAPRWLLAWVERNCRDNDFQCTPIVAKNRTSSILAAVGFQLHLARGQLGCQLAAGPMGSLTFENFVSAGPNLEDRRWHHVAMSVSRNSPTGGKLYVDGSEVLAFDPRKQSGYLSTAEPLRIGNHANQGLHCYFKGQIAGVTVYRRSLSAQEIAGCYRAGRPR